MSEDLERVRRAGEIARGSFQLDAWMIDKVCAEIEVEGGYPVETLVLMGVTKSDAQRWLKSGADALNEHQILVAGSELELCAALVAGVDYAEARLMQEWSKEWTSAVRDAVSGGKNQGANAWRDRLERRFPDRFKVSVASAKIAGLTTEGFDSYARKRASQVPIDPRDEDD